MDTYITIQKSIEAFRKKQEEETLKYKLREAGAAMSLAEYSARINNNYKTLGSIYNYLPNIAIDSVLSLNKLRDINNINAHLLSVANFDKIGKCLDKSLHLWHHKQELTNKAISAQIAVQSHFTRLSEIAYYSERYLSMLGLYQIGASIKLSQQDRYNILIAHNALISSYTEYFNTYAYNIDNIVLKAPSLSLLPSIEVYTNNRFINDISLHENVISDLDSTIIEETDNALDALLINVDPRLLRIWRGAKESIISSNPDRIRHLLISLRELFTHLLQILAPDGELLLWSKDPINYHNDKPTRKSRLKYICRKINQQPLCEFVDKDIDSILSYIDVLQRNHQIEINMKDSQLKSLLLKAETTMRFILEISDNNLS